MKKRIIIWVAVAALAAGITAGININKNKSESHRLEELMATAQEYVNAGDYESAIKMYEETFDIDVTNEEVYMSIADAYIAMGDYDKAKESLDKAGLVLGEEYAMANASVIEDKIKSSHTHDFTEVTCTEGAVCILCGEEGPAALGHDFEEATLNAPKTCKRCGLTEGDPLPGVFEKYGMVCSTDVNGIFEGNLADHGIPFKLELKNYRCFESDDKHEAKDGFVWQSIDMSVRMYLSSDAWTWRHNFGYEDYYDPKLADDTSVSMSGGASKYTVVWDGVTYDDCTRELNGQSDYEPARDGGPSYSVGSSDIHYEFCVPEGYDGNVIWFAPEIADWGDGEYIYDIFKEDYVFVRLPQAIPE